MRVVENLMCTCMRVAQEVIMYKHKEEGHLVAHRVLYIFYSIRHDYNAYIGMEIIICTY